MWAYGLKYRQNGIFTGRSARSAAMPVLFLLTGPKMGHAMIMVWLCTMWVKKSLSPWGILNFSQRLRVFKQNFTWLLYVQITKFYSITTRYCFENYSVSVITNFVIPKRHKKKQKKLEISMHHPPKAMQYRHAPWAILKKICFFLINS